MRTKSGFAATKALEELSHYTPTEIAQKFAADGILNCEYTTNRAKHCPVAQFLQSRGVVDANVLSGESVVRDKPMSITRSGDGEFDICLPEEDYIRNPESVSTFITNFDAGVFDHLRSDRDTWNG